MGRLVDWWLKRGPGSIGPVARVMAQSYKGLGQRYPDTSHEELMAGALARREKIAWLPGYIPPERQALLLQEAEGDFAELILLIWQEENPSKLEGASEGLLGKAYEVIQEVLKEEIAGFDPYSK